MVAVTPKRESQQNGIQSIEIGSRLLMALGEGRGPMTLTEVSKGAALHPAKARRYLISLVRTGLASQNPNTGLYDLGPASRKLGVEALRRTDPVSTASSHAVELRDETGHTVNVAVWSDDGPTIVRWDTGTHALPIVVRVGSTLPLLDSAIGFVFLTFLPKVLTTPILDHQRRQGETHTASTEEIEAIKDAVRRDGFGRTHNNMIFGLAALAAPVFGADGGLESAIGLVLPTRLYTPANIKRYGALLCARADHASRELGLGVA